MSVQDLEIRNKVEKALNNIRPYLEADGGDARILEINDDLEVKVEFIGACGSCPMSSMTLKAGVEESIKRAVPEIKSVYCVNLTSEDNPNAKLPGDFV